MGNYMIGIAAIGACLVLVAWQEYRSLNRRDSALMGGAGTLFLVGSAAMSIFS